MHRPGTRRGLKNTRWVLLLAVVVSLTALQDTSAQQSFATGQTIAPAYEGWERNPDGAFNLVFGYMNRNWEEEIDVPTLSGPSHNYGCIRPPMHPGWWRCSSLTVSHRLWAR